MLCWNRFILSEIIYLKLYSTLEIRFLTHFPCADLQAFFILLVDFCIRLIWDLKNNDVVELNPFRAIIFVDFCPQVNSRRVQY